MMAANSNASDDDLDKGRQVGSALEAARNLLYVCSVDEQTPERIRNYLKMADEQVECVVRLLGYRQ
jgi:hypothetical protein